ncbi:MAG: hypothetical protein ACKV2U_00055 [Bryobacteraceae bacterium]
MSDPLQDRLPVNPELGYDRSEPLTGPILVNIFAIVLILVIVIAGVTFYFNSYRDRIIEETQLTPVSQDLLDLRAKEDQTLNSYGIADKAAGTVRLPVSRAMELVLAEAKEGKPKYPTAPYAVKKVEDVVPPPAPTGDMAPAK